MRILLLACAGATAASLACAREAEAAEMAATVSAGGHPVPDAVVVAVPEAGVRPADKPPQGVVDQIDKEFVPYVTPIRVGSLVQFPNRDHIRHHVYSFSPAKPFELPLYVGTPARPVLFDKPGVVKLGCNIHDWMIGYIYVADTPYFGKTGADGRVVLAALPAGRYRVRVWHPRMEGSEDATMKSVELTQDPAVSVSWQLRLKPEFRPRRAPLPGEPGYR
jgi:plastocyanin